MTTLLSFLRLLAVVVWVGGLCFFAFVLAPASFRVLPSIHEAGLVVGATLIVLHRIAAACGAVFLLTTVALRQRSRPAILQMALVVAMLCFTVFLQRSVLPAMERSRAASGGDIASAPPDAPAHRDFDRLHTLSEHLEGTVLFAGLGVVFLLAAEPPHQPH